MMVEKQEGLARCHIVDIIAGTNISAYIEDIV